METLSKLMAAYSSSSEDDEDSEQLQLRPYKQRGLLNLESVASELQVELAPEVSVTDLQLQKFSNELNHFKNTNQVSAKANHLNGVVEVANINEAKFHEQFHNFENFGHAINPSDNAGLGGRKTVFSNTVKKLDTEANVENALSKERKEYKVELKKKRQKFGDAASGEFMGPWAVYEGMEHFKSQRAELDDDQKELMKRYEEMR